MNSDDIKLTIAFNDPELDSEDHENQALSFMNELKQMSDVIVDRVPDPKPPEQNKAVGAFLPGFLLAEVSVANIKQVLSFLGDRLGSKPIELSVEANGKKLSVKASSRAELEAAIKAAQEFVAA